MSLLTPQAGQLLCEGCQVQIVWPTVEDLRLATELRNRPWVRKHFFNSRGLTLADTLAWYTSLNRPADEFLAIRSKRESVFLGTLGWSGWTGPGGEAEFGRIAMDVSAFSRLERGSRPRRLGLALDATTAMRDYAFQHMQLSAMTTRVHEGNRLAMKLNLSLGFAVTARNLEAGRIILTLRLDRAAWERLPSSGVDQ